MGMIVCVFVSDKKRQADILQIIKPQINKTDCSLLSYASIQIRTANTVRVAYRRFSSGKAHNRRLLQRRISKTRSTLISIVLFQHLDKCDECAGTKVHCLSVAFAVVVVIVSIVVVQLYLCTVSHILSIWFMLIRPFSRVEGNCVSAPLFCSVC